MGGHAAVALRSVGDRGRALPAARPHAAPCNRSPPEGRSAETSARIAETLVTALANFGVDATVVGGDLRAPRDALRAAAGAGDEGREGGGAEGRPLLRPGDDGDPHPRADPGQAGRRRGSPERLPNLVTLGDVFDDLPQAASPLERLAGQGHLRQRGLDRPLAHAAPAHRRDDRLGQVRLHQHDPHVDPPARDAGRRADDPRRPQAHRARLLRVDPAPADARRLQPEAGSSGADERRRRDGAPLRAHVARSARAACPS